MSDEYRTRDQYWDYNDYLKHRCGNNYYNKGLDYKKAGDTTKALEFFKLAPFKLILSKRAKLT